MRLKRQEDGLHITDLPLEDMALLTLAAPLNDGVRAVLKELLSGGRVVVAAQAMEYRRYRKTAPMGIYRTFTAMERMLREMGIIVTRHCDR